MKNLDIYLVHPFDLDRHWHLDLSLIAPFGGNKVKNLLVDAEYFQNCRKSYLNTGSDLCDVQINMDLLDYYFSSTSSASHREMKGAFVLTKALRQPGIYNPRIYRPQFTKSDFGQKSIGYKQKLKSIIDHSLEFDFLPHHNKILTSSVQQLSTIVERLKSLLNNVYPSSKNYSVFSHEIRNLLILSATEVEAQLKGILEANEIKAISKNYTTKDYIKLCGALRLKEFSIKLPYFPEIGALTPFLNWNVTDPTKSLVWYDNYNKTKHDREKCFEKADLISTLNSICAIVILLIAQYGGNIPFWKDLISGFFEIESSPKWKLTDCYLPPFRGNEWVEEKIIL